MYKTSLGWIEQLMMFASHFPFKRSGIIILIVREVLSFVMAVYESWGIGF